MAAKKAAKKVARKAVKKPAPATKTAPKKRLRADGKVAAGDPHRHHDRWDDARCLAFAAAIGEGKTQREAYIIASPHAKKWTYNTVSVKASERARDPRVVKALEDYRTEVHAQLIARGAISLESHLGELAALREEARRVGDFGAAIRAEERRGLAAGFYIERKHVAVAQTVTHVDRAVREIDAVMEDALRPRPGDDLGTDGPAGSLLPAAVHPETPRH